VEASGLQSVRAPEQQEKVRSRRTSRLDGPRSAVWIAFEFLQASLDKRGAQSVPSFREEEKSGAMIPLHVATAESEYRRKPGKGRHQAWQKERAPALALVLSPLPLRVGQGNDLAKK
jgi:hypothetical protein